MSKGKTPKLNSYQASDASQAESTDDILERNKYVYEQVNGWIGNADNKVSISCGIFTGVFGVVTFVAEQYIKVPIKPVIKEYWSYIYKSSFVLSLLFMAAAIILYARAIIPNLKSSGKRNPEKKYPIFYGDIQSLGYDKYKGLMDNGSNADFNDELVLESWYNSGVCMKKMRRYRMGVIMSIFAIGLAFLSFAAHFLMYH